MTGSMMLLTITAILIFCGLLQRVLDRLHMTDRQAWMVIGAMLAGTFLPALQLGPVRINIGGALIPLGVCVYLFVKADERKERWHMIIASLLTAAAVYALSFMLPGEAEALLMDPIWLYGICGGVISWAVGRSRRAAFAGGVTGVILADIVTAIAGWLKGYETTLFLGGAGIADAAVISGVIAVLACELIGETIERLIRGKAQRGETAR